MDKKQKEEELKKLEEELEIAKQTKERVDRARNWADTLEDWQKEWVLIPPFYDVEIIEDKINKLKNG